MNDTPPAWTSPGEPPAQPPTQPSLEARPDLPQQQGYAYPPPVANPADPYYAQYTQPLPPAPAKRSNAGVVALIVIVAVLMVAGAGAGYFLLGRESEGTLTAGSSSEAEEPTDAATSAAPSAEESPAPEFPGEMIPFESVGVQMPVPSANWELENGPGATGDGDVGDMSAYAIQYEENWYASLVVGTYQVEELPYAVAAIDELATELTGFWSEQSAANGMQGTATEPVLTEFEIDGHPAVIGEAKASWTSVENSPDLYERVIVFILDIDGANALYGLAFIPESADAEYDAMLAAFQAAEFTA
jgi:hypothetical protein